KDKIINENPKLNKNKLYLHQFNINVNHFIKTDEVVRKNTYLVYDGENEDNIIDVTNEI
ncbi:B12-binding domain-containing radical SAM protein, partial [Clostridium botulinum D/C]|nr:B12-binding domain-containing radical SAM protein [Clostridium botulinum D/C]